MPNIQKTVQKKNNVENAKRWYPGQISVSKNWSFSGFKTPVMWSNPYDKNDDDDEDDEDDSI